MRSILAKLFLSFTLIILLSGLISALVAFSFSRRSVESFRHDFHRQLQANIARSVVLMGQAAYVMQQHRGSQAFTEYIQEIQSSMRTQLYLCINDTVMPQDMDPVRNVCHRAAAVGATDQPTIEDTGKELIIVQRLFAPEGQSYVVVGLHQLQPPPGWGKGPPPQPGAGPGLHPLPAGPGGPPPPPSKADFFSFWNGPEFHTFVLLLIAGIVCFKLARTFSAPLARLRTASRQIASGNLSARVGINLGKQGSEMGDLARDFDHMAERMEGLVNAQKRLLRDISHELRSPLTRLNLALELAKKHLQTAADDNLNRIARESERLNTLIGQLLTLTRSEGYTPDADALPVDLAQLVQEIAEDVGFEWTNTGREVTIITLEALAVNGSRELLRQAVENIVRNGAYYTRPHSHVEVHLFARQDDAAGTQTAVIQVRDHGPGVPDEQLPHILEPFYRVARARDRNSGGTGLGLAIAHQAVQQHGGTLRIANALDRDGLVVEIVLPLPE